MEQEQNRTEAATPFKLAEAKKRGQVAKSLDFNTMLGVWGLLAVVTVCAGDAAVRTAEVCRELLIASGALRIERLGDLALLATPGRSVVTVVAPFLAVGILVAVAANLLQTGFVFSPQAIKPQFERLNPAAGLKRLFNKRMLMEALKAILKLAFVGGIAYAFFRALWPAFPTLQSGHALFQTAWLGEMAQALLARLAVALLVIGVIDLAWSRFQFSRQMMMSRRELKEEVKRREGDPHVRARIRELQRENLKQASSMGRVGEADVLITNPEHLAIALRYVPGAMQAPHVIAKGADLWAAEMRAHARRHGIPVLERRPLARKLFSTASLDQPIPPDTFVEVAHVYAGLGERRRAASVTAGAVRC